MNASTTADNLHRLVKHALDSGQAANIAEAQAIFAGYRLSFRIDEKHISDRHHQAALLTCMTLARRVFLGGITLDVSTDAPLCVPLAIGLSLIEAARALGAEIARAPAGAPLIDIGGAPCPRQSRFHVRALFSGWRGGIVPAHLALTPSPTAPMALTPMLAAALAINEAFLFVSGVDSAGRRPVGISLFDPTLGCDWLTPQDAEPALEALPSRLWLIGLGHLGQAYLWALGLLPYADPKAVHLVLQDIDVITPSTESTSILSDAVLIGQKKTRAMATWAERRGFTTAIHERVFDKNFRRRSDEPSVALCGIDNRLGRLALDQVGFDFVVEAGLGRGYRDFRAIRLHTLPSARSAAQIWRHEGSIEEVHDRPAYADMLARGVLDRCGVTLLAGKAVGAPFVGSVASTLAVAEILRLLQGGSAHELIDLDLKDIDQRVVVAGRQKFLGFNPGFVAAEGQESQACAGTDSGAVRPSLAKSDLGTMAKGGD